MKKYQKIITAILSALFFIGVMSLTEQILKPGYLIKSVIKVSAFALILTVSTQILGKNLKEMIFFREMKPAKNLYIFMAIVFFGVILGFLLIRNQLDLLSIKQNLISKEQLTKQNCLFVFAYIALINSFLEESLFRGFLYHLFDNQKIGMLFSSLSFSIYHLGIINHWLNPLILAFCMIGLFAVGIFLQIISNHYDSIKASWIVHGCANLSINAIGFILIWLY